MIFINSAWIVLILIPNAKGMATLNMPSSANCGNQSVLMCTSTECNLGYRFLKDGVDIYTNTGPRNGADSDRYSATVTSNSLVQLTIINIQLSDSGAYACQCGFGDTSASKTMLYTCKAATSTTTITNEKKLSITVDMLYPNPSRVDTSLTSLSTPLTGMYSCWPSSLLASHYRCTWVSTESLPDGNHGYTMTVTTGSEAAPVNGSFRIVTPTSPTISYLLAISANRQVLRGVQDTLQTIQCVSSGGIPAPTLAWYRGNMSTSPIVQSSTSDSVQMLDGTYNLTLTHIFTPRRADDLNTFLCRVFYPDATNEASPNPSPTTALLYIDLKPDTTDVSQTGGAVSGGSMTLLCSSANGRPAPNITWSYQGQTWTPINTLSYDPTSETYTAVSVLQRPVSAADNGQRATCMVLHTTLSVPITRTINVDVKFSPSTRSTTISGNLPTPATGASQIRINCTSGSSNPASNISWFNGSDVITNSEEYTRWSGDNNGVVISNILTITPTRYMDGDRITCRTDNGYGSDSTYVDLDILYPPLIQTLLNITSIEGEPDVSLTCVASSKPPATFHWNKEDKVLASGTGTNKDNSFSYIIPRVYRSDGGSYQCRAGNSIGSSDIKIVQLIVKYPPAVTVSATFPPSNIVTCKAEGYPDSYTYQDWVQIWPGYGPVATIPFTGTTLNLNGATYERSGVYVCSASNGVAVYGTDMKFMKGNTTVLIKAPPVLTDPSSDGRRVFVAGSLGQDATTEIKYWSNVDGSVVKCFKRVADSRSVFSSCSVTETDTKVTLPVNNHMVTETGTLVTIKIHISSQDDMTAYDVVVSNSEQGESVLGITIVPQGNFSITPGQVILTVIPGFHGGYNQTLVVQISTDLTMWINKTSVYVGQEYRRTAIILDSLMENTLHYVRVFSYNIEGGSNFSTVMTFTTDKDIALPSTSTATVAGSIVGGIVVLVAIGLGILLYRRYECLIKLKQKKPKLSDDVPMTDSRNIYESAVPARDSAHVYSQLHQQEIMSGDQHRLNNTGLYESPNSLTLPEHVYSVLSAPAKENLYANQRV